MLTTTSKDKNPSLEELFSTLYNIDERPFYFAGRTFAQLAQHVQHFLLKNGFVIEQDVQQKGLSQEELVDHFNRLLEVREAELSVLERNTCGVHRAIVSEMLSLPPSHNNDNSEGMEKLRSVLIPEWRRHLDECLDRNDALIWFEIEMRRGSAYEMQPEVYLRDRLEDVKCMVQFAAQGLQLTKERMERERLAEKLLVELEAGVDRLEEQAEPYTSDEGTSDGLTSGATSEYDEFLFSENEYLANHDISWDSDSETRSYLRDLNLSRLSAKTGSLVPFLQSK